MESSITCLLICCPIFRTWNTSSLTHWYIKPLTVHEICEEGTVFGHPNPTAFSRLWIWRALSWGIWHQSVKNWALINYWKGKINSYATSWVSDLHISHQSLVLVLVQSMSKNVKFSRKVLTLAPVFISQPILTLSHSPPTRHAAALISQWAFPQLFHSEVWVPLVTPLQRSTQFSFSYSLLSTFSNRIA